MTGGYWGSTLEGGGVTVQGSGWKQQWGGRRSPGRLHEVREGGADVWGGGVTVVVVPGVRVVPCRCGCRWGVPGLAGGAVLLRGVPCNAALPCSRKVGGWLSLGRGGGEAVPGTPLPGRGGTVQGRDPHPGGVSRGGLGGAHGNPSLPPACSALPGRPCPAPRCSPEPPGVPVPLHAVCLRRG